MVYIFFFFTLIFVLTNILHMDPVLDNLLSLDKWILCLYTPLIWQLINIFLTGITKNRLYVLFAPLIWQLISSFLTGITADRFKSDTIFWKEQTNHYWKLMSVDQTEIRNVMDMNAYCGGFAVALNALPLWVMNIVPISMNNTLSAIYDRGLIGAFHDW